MKYLELVDLSCYEKSFKLSNYVWNIVVEWKWFEKSTVGEQLVRATDSVSANIAEGFGRYGKKDKIKFYFYSLGSLKESTDWIEKAQSRGLLTKEQYGHVTVALSSLPKEIHYLIKFTNEKLTI